ncbi:hypothetical protein I350_02927 [Cryptococcus amylolentus CBS 6273]|uniref:Uncharacterized protein n=1 Tax=Cryptococcus amylolentus CBS 6273 TaxID=1296118 RepID=A0A1E3K9X7_9TREE|nr:hypothetical protein I350_02927 [Cryptococcus amylolentus CBS 6273]
MSTRDTPIRPPPVTHLAYLRSYSSPSHFHSTTSYNAFARPRLKLHPRRTTQPHILARDAPPTPDTQALSPVNSSTSSTSSNASSTRGLLSMERKHRRDDAEANWQEDMEEEGEEFSGRGPWRRRAHEWNPWIAGCLQILLNVTMVALFSTPPDSRKWFLFANAVGSVVAFVFGIITLEFRRIWKTKEVRPVDFFLFFAALCNAVAISFMFVAVFRGYVGG